MIRNHNKSAEELGEEFADEDGGDEALEMLKAMKYELKFEFKETLRNVESNVEGSDQDPDHKNAMGPNKRSYELKTDFAVVTEHSNGGLSCTLIYSSCLGNLADAQDHARDDDMTVDSSQ